MEDGRNGGGGGGIGGGGGKCEGGGAKEREEKGEGKGVEDKVVCKRGTVLYMVCLKKRWQ